MIEKGFFDEKIFTYEELKEYKKLYVNMENLPEENIIKECILVIMYEDFSIGLKVVNGENIVAFKIINIQNNNSNLKIICKKYRVTEYHAIKFNDIIFLLFLFINTYLNEIVSEEMWTYLAIIYQKVIKRNKYFKNKIFELFKPK